MKRVAGTYMGRMRDWPSTKLTPIHARSSWWPKVSTIVGWMVATFQKDRQRQYGYLVFESEGTHDGVVEGEEQDCRHEGGIG